jgi:hypothetical protein
VYLNCNHFIPQEEFLVLLRMASRTYAHRRCNGFERELGAHTTDRRRGWFRRHILDGVVRHGSLSRRQGEVAAETDYSSTIASHEVDESKGAAAAPIPWHTADIMHHLCSYILLYTPISYNMARRGSKKSTPVIEPLSAAI